MKLDMVAPKPKHEAVRPTDEGRGHDIEIRVLPTTKINLVWEDKTQVSLTQNIETPGPKCNISHEVRMNQTKHSTTNAIQNLGTKEEGIPRVPP